MKYVLIPFVASSVSNSDWIEASSAAEAIRKALAGSFTDSTTGKTYTFSNSGAFEYNPDLQLDEETDVGPALIIEDHFGVTPADYDWTDAYIPLTVTQDQLSVQVTSTEGDSGDGTGLFQSTDLAATADDFTAVIEWADHSTSDGEITEERPGVFAVEPIGDVPTGDTADGYILTVTHSATGLSSSGTFGIVPDESPGLMRSARTMIEPFVGTTKTVAPADYNATAPTALIARTVLSAAAMKEGHGAELDSRTATVEKTSGQKKYLPAPDKFYHGRLINGSLPDSMTLKWSGELGNKYQVFYSDIRSMARKYKLTPQFGTKLVSSTLGKSPTQKDTATFTKTIKFSDLLGANINRGSWYDTSSSARFGHGIHTYYFTILATHILKSGKSQLKYSKVFCAPQINFFGGQTQGDGDLGNRNHYAQNNVQIAGIDIHTAFSEAAWLDQQLGAQTTTFAWNDNPVASNFPSGVPLVLMGQSLGGGKAAHIASNLNASGSSHRTVAYLGLFDPVSGSFDDDQDQTSGVSSFTVTANVTTAHDWFATGSEESSQGDDVSGHPFPTGSIDNESSVYLNTQFPLITVDSARPWLAGATHTSQIYNPTALGVYMPAIQKLKWNV